MIPALPAVWLPLCPPGLGGAGPHPLWGTVSYGELAKRCGTEGVQAVGTAAGNNPLPLTPALPPGNPSRWGSGAVQRRGGAQHQASPSPAGGCRLSGAGHLTKKRRQCRRFFVSPIIQSGKRTTWAKISMPTSREEMEMCSRQCGRLRPEYPRSRPPAPLGTRGCCIGGAGAGGHFQPMLLGRRCGTSSTRWELSTSPFRAGCPPVPHPPPPPMLR